MSTFPITAHLIVETGSLTAPGAHQLSLGASVILPVPTLPSTQFWGYTCVSPMSGFPQYFHPTSDKPLQTGSSLYPKYFLLHCIQWGFPS